MLALLGLSAGLRPQPQTTARRTILQHTAAAATATVAATVAPRRAAAVAYRSEPFSATAAPGRTKAKCRDLESCQAEGERRAAEAEAKAGPLRRVGPPGADGLGRVRYRAMTETADGPPLRQVRRCATLTLPLTPTRTRTRTTAPGRRCGGAVFRGKHGRRLHIWRALARAGRGRHRRRLGLVPAGAGLTRRATGGRAGAGGCADSLCLGYEGPSTAAPCSAWYPTISI